MCPGSSGSVVSALLFGVRRRSKSRWLQGVYMGTSHIPIAARAEEHDVERKIPKFDRSGVEIFINNPSELLLLHMCEILKSSYLVGYGSPHG